ncbi:MAG: ATP-dependent RNA helicase HrpA, partial [Planctomycetota bacterium]
MSARADELADLIREHQVLVVCGETGSGKSTQLPKICLAAGRGVHGLIGHTQPRRLAARSIASRLAEELGTTVGEKVGFTVRFTDATSPGTLVKVMTDGILLAEIPRDRTLAAYDTIIIDEAHERSLNIDFLLGYLRQLLPKRPDLKIIITSATIDPGRFSEHFNDAPIIEVSGRTYPVEIRYQPPQRDEESGEEQDQSDAILSAVDELYSEGPGDILIFLSGEREIRDMADTLRKQNLPQTEVLPLYARLAGVEQDRVFKPHQGRRIVLATNVAETSLTVPGIRYVIDPGFARISRYSPRNRVQRLPIEAISQASANQRAGRCGRLDNGICIRLYTEEDFRQREEFTPPEILRTNLASVILQMKALRLGPIEDFPFVEPPRRTMVREGYQTLEELGAVDPETGNITQIGHRLARFPVDPRIGRMLLAGQKEHCLTEMLIIASALSIQDPRERPMEKADEADKAHEKFLDEQSDFLAYINLWKQWRELSRKLSGSKLRRYCRDNFISYLRMREWQDVHHQLESMLREDGVRPNADPAEYNPIHRALLAGLLSNVGHLKNNYEYQGCGGIRFMIFPGSVMFRKTPKWMMAAELVETTKLYARTVAKIQPDWIEELGGHLLKKSWSDPVWRGRAGRVMAFERAALYGLEIYARRSVPYATVDPAEARRIFIRDGLVEGDIQTRGKFLEANRRLLDEVRDIESRIRRRGIVAEEEQRLQFYDRVVPDDVWDAPRFEKWRKAIERRQPQILHMKREDVLAMGLPPIEPADYPDALEIDGLRLPLSYQLEPGHPRDGVTVQIPVEAINQITEQRLSWIIPGWRLEKVLALIRSLPKQLRLNFLPAQEVAEHVSRRIGTLGPRNDVSFVEA